MDRFPRSDSIVQQTRSGLQTYMAQVYGWMTVGLLLTAFIAWYAANTPELMMFIFSSKITFFGLILRNWRWYSCSPGWCTSSARAWRPRCLCSIRR